MQDNSPWTSHPGGQVHQVHVDERDGLVCHLIQTGNGSPQGQDLLERGSNTYVKPFQELDI